MRFPRHLIRISAAASPLLMANAAVAKGGGVAPDTGAATNWLEMLLLFTAFVLLFVIWGLAQALLAFSRLLARKNRPAAASISLLILLTAMPDGLSAQEGMAAAAPANLGGLSELQFYFLAAVIGVEVFVILFLALLTRRAYRSLTEEPATLHAAEESRTPSFVAWWNRLDKRIFTRAVPVEKEADVLLDHDYDGIRELDNALPPWWKYGFYVTLVAAVAYMFNFHFLGTGKSPEQEYAAEMVEGRRQEEAYKARTKDLVDEDNVTLADAAGIAAGKALYTQSCTACHANDGGGGIGPNLADEFWLHGGGMNDIYRTIKVGWPEKGMQSWESLYNPMQMRNLASYVKSLQGTSPANPKEPQGEAYTPNDTPTTSNISTSNAAGK